jgi:DNA-binding transcriptional ArsR family regulator
MGEDEEEDDIRKDIKELSEKIEKLEETLSKISKPYTDIVGYMNQFQNISKGYFRLLDLYDKHGSLSPEIIIPGLKDPISKDIVIILFNKKEQNISQITEELKKRRGTASRRIVRERLQSLMEENVVVCEEGSKTKKYSISEEVVEKWSQVLGLPK